MAYQGAGRQTADLVSGQHDVTEKETEGTGRDRHRHRHRHGRYAQDRRVCMHGGADERNEVVEQLCQPRYHYGVERTTIMLPDPLRERLRQLAAERGVSMANLVREALEELVANARPTPRSLGIGASGSTDTARRTAVERPEPRPWR
jgi:CopG-like RHH_1 or ribbon-helix-helix domain, RHH_5